MYNCFCALWIYNSTLSLQILCCKACVKIGEQYYPYLLCGRSETWQLVLKYPLNLRVCQVSRCSLRLKLVIATGKMSTAARSGESECQLSFALSDVSEEMEAGGRIESDYCLLVP